jgi:hypothetical protein
MTSPFVAVRFTVVTVALTVLALSGTGRAATSADGMWSDLPSDAVEVLPPPAIRPARFRVVSLDWQAFDRTMGAAPLETRPAALANGAELSLPAPDGGFERFLVAEAPIMEAGLAARYPEITTWRGQGLDDPTASARLDRTPHGFHAMVTTGSGSYFIDPHSRGDVETYISYRKADLADPHAGTFACEVMHDGGSEGPDGAVERSGETLRTYRLAVAATGEYTIYHGGTVPDGMAAIVTAMNRVNQIYEREVAIRMVLVESNDLVVYTNPSTDPYSNNNGSAMLGQNQANLDSVIGDANYDIGHVFSTGGGGVASRRVPCVSGSKARGVTGLPSPTGDPFYVDYVAHEMGHQWSANHSFNGSAGACAGNRVAQTAYEPGSGSTIMAYAGLCGAHNLQNYSDDYFHGISQIEIADYSSFGTGSTCAAESATGNLAPTVEAGPSHVIPLSTPFALCGSAVDPDGDDLSYGWEQFNLGPAGHPNFPVNNAPIFRSFDPAPTGERIFPRAFDLVNNVQTIGEILPGYPRTLIFRLFARDNRSGGGGVAFDTTSVSVSDVGGPFLVTSPNTAVTWTGGSSQVVTWDVAGTELAPISCAAVDIALSEDRGWSFPITLVAGTPNDGSEAVDLPDLQTTHGRIRVSCSDGIFFDISDVDFTLTGSQALLFATGMDGCGEGLSAWSDVVQ